MDYTANLQLLIDDIKWKQSTFPIESIEPRLKFETRLLLQGGKRNTTPNLSLSELKSYKELMDDESIVILKTDKVDCFVVMDRIDYFTKGNAYLNNAQFIKFDNFEAENQYKSLQNFIYRLKTLKQISEDDRKAMMPHGAACNTAYFLPKIHKPDFQNKLKLRPIVPNTNYFNYNLARFLAKKLRLCSNLENRNSFHFCDTLKLQTTKDCKMIGLDVENLYPSVPVDEAITLAADILERKWTVKRKYIEKLLRFCTTETVFQFDGKYYKQSTGLAMGSPISPVLAELFMLNLEKDGIAGCTQNIKLYYRYVDDCFLLLGTETDSKELLRSLNNWHANIKFTLDAESDSTMNFLDVRVEKEQNGFSTSVFRKPQNPGLFMRWDSSHSKVYKKRLMSTMLSRAFKLCSTSVLFDRECDNLFRMFRESGYPVNVIKSAFRRFNKIIRTAVSKDADCVPVSDKKNVFFRVPYCGPNSEKYAYKVRSIVSARDKKLDVIPYFKRSSSLLQCFARKLRPRDFNAPCVYQIDCSDCSTSYVGETGRLLSQRVKEHKAYGIEDDSAIAQHRFTTGHKINFEEPKILCLENDIRRRKIMESLFMAKTSVFSGNTSRTVVKI